MLLRLKFGVIFVWLVFGLQNFFSLGVVSRCVYWKVWLELEVDSLYGHKLRCLPINVNSKFVVVEMTEIADFLLFSIGKLILIV